MMSNSATFSLLLVLSIGSAYAFVQSKPGKEYAAYQKLFEFDLCETVYCNRGEECVLSGGVARCECITWCPPTGRQICASDGNTYESHCQMHRQECLTKNRLHVIKHRECPPQLLPKTDILTEDDDTSMQQAKPSYTFPKVYTWEESERMDRRQSPEGIQTIIETSTDTDTDKDYYDKLDDTYEQYDIVQNTKTSMTKPQSNKPEEAKKNDSNTAELSTNLTVEILDDYSYECEKGDIVFLKNNLLLYFHAKYGEFEEGYDHRDKSHLVEIMLDHLDVNKDGQISKEDLDLLERTEALYLKLLPPGCSLTHLIPNIDLDGDDIINRKEFLNGFGVSTAFLKEAEHVIYHSVPAGSEYQILCTIEPRNDAALRRRWFRHGRPLTHVPEYNMKVHNSVMYLAPARLEHSGNFSCKAQDTEQVHVVLVKEPINVQVWPSFLLLTTGESGEVQCLAKGADWLIAKLRWRKNKKILATNLSTLTFESAHRSNTGTYTCEVDTENGLQTASTSVVVRDTFQQPEITMKSSQENHPKVVVFEKTGVHMYSTVDCLTRKVIPSTYVGLDLNRPYLCHRSRCSWTDAVVLDNGIIYALLKEERALAIMNINNSTVLQLIELESGGERLLYNKATDTVWVVGVMGAQGRDIVLIKEASTMAAKKSVNHAMANENVKIDDVFLPPVDSLVDYGYVSIGDGNKLSKVKLASADFVSQVDLSTHSCKPTNIAFATAVGIVVVYCNDEHGVTGRQIVLDYLSDVALSVHDDKVIGTPLILKDRSLLITVNHWNGQVFLQNFMDRNLSMWMSSEWNVPLSDWLVESSGGVYAYTLHALSPYTDHIISLNLSNANVGKLTGIKETPALTPSVRGRLLIKYCPAPGAQPTPLYAFINGGSITVTSSLDPIKPNTKCNINPNDNVQFIKWLN